MFMRSKYLPILLVAVAALALVMILIIPGYAQRAASRTQTPTSASPSSGFDIPPEVKGHEKEWPLANHDYANTRAAVGSSINASNVSTLKVAWTSPLHGTSEWGGGTGNPIISDGVVYFQDMQANVYAV